MRNWILIGVISALVVAGAAWLWSHSESGPRSPASAASLDSTPKSLPEFSAVEVSSGGQEGLALTGRVLDASGKPVSGAEVFLAASAERTLADVRCDECDQALLSCPARESALHTLAFFEQERGFLSPRATVRTDEQGRFRFEHLVGVSFSVWARASGLGVALRDRAAPGDPVELYLPPLRSIRGQVVDEAGQPLKGARVHAVSRRVPLPFEAESGAEGAFSLDGLGEGPFYVLAMAEGYLPAVEAHVEAGPQPVRLQLTPARTLEVRVMRQGQPAAATVRLRADHLSRELRTEGEVVRFTGLYPDELVVTAEAPGLGSAPRTLTLDARVTQVTLELEEAGKLLVTVVDEAGQPVPTPELMLRTSRGELVRRERAATGALVELGPLAVGEYLLEGKAEGFRDVQLPARVGKGETTLELELERATLITGRVMDEYGRPAPRVSVLVQPTGESVLADGEGRFAAQVPTPGLYELHAHHSEWGGGQVKVTAPASGVELPLEPHAALEVTVSSGGRRVEGADVVLWVDQEGIFRSDRPSGPDGVVPMRGLPEGSYSMVASHPDYQPSERRQVTVVEGQTLKLEAELKPGAPLTGDVVDTQGTPVAGASLSVVPRGAEPVISDARGHFEFRSLRPDRGYRLEVKHSGYDQTERAEGKAGGPPVKVVLKKRDVFRGRVVGDDGAPVRRFRMDEHQVDSPDGRFELALPTAGDRVIVAVDASGYEPLMVDRPVSPELGDLVLEKLPSISGLVRDASGGPVADAVVSCEVCDESVLSGPDGRFTLASPPYVARYTVSARKGRLSGTQAVERGNRAALELTLKQATRLSGRVFRPGGQPAAGIEVEAVNGDRGEPLTIVTGPDGGYSVDVAPGSYRFMLGSGLEYSGEPALVVQVGGAEMHLDLGPSPGSASLTVQLKPERGKALWVVAGEVPVSSNPPAQELMRSRWAHLVYQPRTEQVIVSGLPPGRYTVVWGAFHVETPGGPEVRVVDVPSRGELTLGR
ncbi:carboxypeptidase regulatory-like domain-containing protein [Myxococcus sp. CA056]|uniref:carboxypeptidase regulatory-like domain-containing protein n=1 Tax=unclassified Myxococcus TaxID=2648731 RepID=UPI00157B9CD1|nr:MULTISPECIES: carboxypeptidase regulatory-like domain-containing protein [unclassified Myxococcus]NTX14525.1 carboxypeptidase regulatory-like domain-containing protein [Myxococcus sp. CA056]NTX53824.1 carboxypeptidase regulatory-like domain-containing protein [Myxococcus sp. CA039A]